MSTLAPEKPVTLPDYDGPGGNDDPDRYAHYVKKDILTDAYVFGTEVEALCGYRFVPRRDPDRHRVCPRCKALRASGMSLG